MDALSMKVVHRLRPDPVRLRSLALLLAIYLFASETTFAQPSPSEYDLKAAFVYQFLAYVTWPDAKTPDGPLVVGVLGASELAGNLSALASQTGGVRPIEVRMLTPDSDPRDLHVLFVAADLAGESAVLLQTASANAVLTVTEALPRSPYSMINFEIIGSKVRFDIALDLARRNGMDISARLLQVALRVMEQP